MIKPFLYVLVFCLSLNLFGQTQETHKSVELFNSSELLYHLKNLSSDAFEGRRTGSRGGIKAKNYIIDAFTKLDVSPLDKGNFEQTFLFEKSGVPYKGANVLGLIEGTSRKNKYIVISAHYDHEGIKYDQIYNGADDNASGISGLIVMAKYFKENPLKHSVILAAFDAEELGLRGSEYYLKYPIVNKKNIVLNVNLDMISRSDDNNLFVVGTAHNSQLRNSIVGFRFNENIKLTAGHDGFDGKQNWTFSSDQGSFFKKGIPFLYFGVADHQDYHKPTDDYENIQPAFYTEAVKTIIAVIKKVDNISFSKVGF